MKWSWIHKIRILHNIESLKISIESLKADRKCLERSLERARVMNFIQVVDYKKGMSLCDDRPNPILLEDLLERIEELETQTRERNEYEYTTMIQDSE